MGPVVVRVKGVAGGGVSWSRGAREGRRTRSTPRSRMGVWSRTYPRWLPGGGACSQQHRSARACDPACASEHCCHPTVAEGIVPALLVYVCVRAQECPDRRLFTKQPFGCFSPRHADTVIAVNLYVETSPLRTKRIPFLFRFYMKMNRGGSS